MMKVLALLGILVLGAGLTPAGVLTTAGSETSDDALPGFVLGTREDEPCPVGSITGQIPSACGTTIWYFYSDLEFTSGTLSRRVRCEDFPKTGLLDPNDPNQAIGVITWYGVNVDPNANGCDKGQPGTYLFRIRFYSDNAGAPNPNFVYEEVVAPEMTDTGETVLLATIPAIRWKYTVYLSTPQHMAHGWFSICGQGSAGCYSLWEGSGTDGGDNKIYQWWEVGGTIPGPAVVDKCDLDYCFEAARTGACCHGATGNCEDNFPERYCHAAFDRFYPDTTCDQLQPPCSNVMTGACCCPDGVCFILTYIECLNSPCVPPPPCPGDANCDGVRDFDDINFLVAVLWGAVPCRFENLDANSNGIIDFDDINPFVGLLGVPCPTARTGGLWLGPGTTCDQCPCFIDCNSPTHPEQEPCGADTNGGCNSATDPNDPNTVNPAAWEDLGVLDPNHPTVVCGTVWADNGTRDTDWYTFSLATRGTLSWVTETESVPLLSTPVFGDGDLGAPTIPVNCNGPLWGYWNVPPAWPCFPSHMAPTDVFPAGPTYWWVVFPDSGHAIFYGYPCTASESEYRITITATTVVCNPCQGTDIAEGEPACGPSYVDTFNAGCDAGGGFPVQAAINPATWYCGQSGAWTDPNGNPQVDYDWWKIVLTGTIRKRLQIQMRSAFNMRWELYTVPSGNCANKARLDYYEFDACDANVSIYTSCLTPNNSAYYIRIVPTDDVSCSQHNTYRFQYSVVNEAPACTACSVVCTTSPDDACQSGPNDPETNAGCNGEMPPGGFMEFTPGDNTYGPKYCGRLSTFTGSDGTPRADLDWFRYTQPAGRTKLVIRAKAMFRVSINIGNGCGDPNSVSHGWDRPCKGTTTAATQTWLILTPGTTYTGVVIYSNGGGDGTGEQPMKQFFFGLPCSDSRNTYELELQAQT
jgi:hypothetical protein